MGGSRCYFRQCHVSAQKFPRMHYFRFPLKELERFKKWRQYSKMEHMLEFSDVRQRNTNICGRHFRPECFMNYKMDRLVPTAVPTIMRLSTDKALDFELDIEVGVLVTLEMPKFKHLLPPDGFECPLFLTNDKVLLEKLNELECRQHKETENLQLDYIDSAEPKSSKVFLPEDPSKTLVKSVEILETIQVSAPTLKRPRPQKADENPASSTSLRNKKCRILNTSNCASGNDILNGSTVILSSRLIQLENDDVEIDDISFVEAIETENISEMENTNGQLFLTDESFLSDDHEDIELFEIQNDENRLHCELPLHDSDATIVQLKSINQVDSNLTNAENCEFLNMQKLLLKKKKDFDALHTKFLILESENNELRQGCQENEEIKRKLHLVQVENITLKKSLEEYDLMKQKMHKYCEENKTLEAEIANMESLRSELLSRKEETKELKKLLDTKKDLGELEIKNKEINGLRKKFDISQKQLKDTAAELKDVKNKLNIMKDEFSKSVGDIRNEINVKQKQYDKLKSDFNNLEQNHSILQQKYWKLQALQNQETAVSTSVEKNNENADRTNPSTPSSLTKAQLFNGIKRYLCSSMVSLLRMEMFGSAEREWKMDERQVAVDILRLGEPVFQYFTEEWRLRLPALRDVRNWLSQSQQLLDDEEDL